MCIEVTRISDLVESMKKSLFCSIIFMSQISIAAQFNTEINCTGEKAGTKIYLQASSLDSATINKSNVLLIYGKGLRETFKFVPTKNNIPAMSEGHGAVASVANIKFYLLLFGSFSKKRRCNDHRIG